MYMGRFCNKADRKSDKILFQFCLGFGKAVKK